MTKQTNAPLTRQALHMSAGEAIGLVNEFDEGLLLLDAPYQRGSVWTTEQREGLIRSWLTELPVPAIILNDRREGGWTTPDGQRDFTLAVVDGRQRIETAIAWFKGELTVPASWFPSEQVETSVDTDDGPYVTFRGLTVEGQRFVKRLAQFPIALASVPTLADEASIYLLVNGAGTPQAQADIENARSFL